MAVNERVGLEAVDGLVVIDRPEREDGARGDDRPSGRDAGHRRDCAADRSWFRRGKGKGRLVSRPAIKFFSVVDDIDHVAARLGENR